MSCWKRRSAPSLCAGEAHSLTVGPCGSTHICVTPGMAIGSADTAATPGTDRGRSIIRAAHHTRLTRGSGSCSSVVCDLSRLR
eukprot:399863-Prymnesium_polylepis.2